MIKNYTFKKLWAFTFTFCMLFISIFGYFPTSTYATNSGDNGVNGSVEIISSKESNLEESYKIGNYSIKSGSEVIIRLTPDYGYQLNKDTFKDINLTALDSACEYKLTMPNRNINLSDMFIKSDDIINLESNLIKDVSIDIPKNDIHGNAIFTVTPIKKPANENEFKNKASGFDILEYVDITLEEVIYKGGDINNGCWKRKISALDYPMQVTFKFKENKIKSKNYCIIRDHEGDVSKINDVCKLNGETLKFSTDKYSNYAIASSDDVRTLEATVNYNGENIKIIIQDPKNVLSDDAVLEVTLAEENGLRYNEIKKNLDNAKIFEHIALFDIIIYKDQSKNEKYSELSDNVNVFFQIPSGWDKNELQAVLVAEGVDGQFQEEVVKDNNIDYLAFGTNHFSPYAFLDEYSAEELNDYISSLSPEKIRELLTSITDDEMVKLLSSLSEKGWKKILSSLTEEERNALLSGLPEETRKQLLSLLDDDDDKTGATAVAKENNNSNDDSAVYYTPDDDATSTTFQTGDKTKYIIICAAVILAISLVSLIVFKNKQKNK